MSNADPGARELSSVQQGMVFHYLSNGRATGVDIEQVVVEIRHTVNSDLLQDAWQLFIDRTGELRSYIDLDGSPPSQLVSEAIQCKLQIDDWPECEDQASIERNLDRYLAADRARGFDIATPPLFRVALFTVSDDRHYLVWTFHHLLLDGRSFALSLADIFDIYDALSQGLAPPDIDRPARDSYARWMANLNWSRSLPYWRDLVSSVAMTTTLKPAVSEAESKSIGGSKDEVVAEFDVESTEALSSWAAGSGVSLNALVQSAWAILHARYNGSSDVVLGNTRAGRAGTVADAENMLGTFITTTPVRFQLDELSAIDIVRNTRSQHVKVRKHEHTPLADIQALTDVPVGTPLFESLVIYDWMSLNDRMRQVRPNWTDRKFWFAEKTPYPFTLYVYEQPALTFKLAFDCDRLSRKHALAALEHLKVIIQGIADRPDEPWSTLPLLTAEENDHLLQTLNDTTKPIPEDTIHRQFDRMVEICPTRESVVSGESAITYAGLQKRANDLAAALQGQGAEPGDVIGICIDRTIDMVAAILGILKAGCAYLPLDPDYPAHRTDYCLSDSGARILITSSDLESQFRSISADLHVVDRKYELDPIPPYREPATKPDDLAYSIYTSGSTGNPKGVLVEHRNVINFFEGMDDVVVDSDRKRWLAVTSMSFDISVLELLWTLTRGYTVVLAGGADDSQIRNSGQRKMGFSLFYFASDPGGVGREKYDLVLKGAKFADEHGFEAVWTPERHFHAFGGLYPNPSVIGAAVAAVTRNIGVRSGSVVLPLHHPLRVVEEWSLVDNLCNGRVGLSVASGWQPNDFVLAPDRYEDRKESMYDDIETIRKLWRGEQVEFENPKGDMVQISTLPRPVQDELPVWVTAAGSPGTFRKAGEIGANLLTHLLGQTIDEVAEKIRVYRQARDEAGYSSRGQVTLMLHTLVGTNNDEIREAVREPMKNYLRSAASLVSQYADAWTAYKQGAGASVTDSKAFDELSDEEMDSLLDFAFERYYETSALFGTPEKCSALVEQAHLAGVDEIACLIDFGVENQQALDNLQHLNSLKTQSHRRISAREINFSDLVLAHDISHMQCTPSGARTMLGEERCKDALAQLDQLLVGGEAFPNDLWQRLKDTGVRKVVNMYGPTETTIWSTSHTLGSDSDNVLIGTPIANTRCYVLDKNKQLVPPGVPGVLFIGGSGVTRGYHERPDLTASCFEPDPFARSGNSMMYSTGDVVRWDDSGSLEFLGRVDHQVKVRGFRVELGEIESRLSEYAAIDQAVVAAIEGQDGSQELVAYCKPVPEGDFAPQSVAAYLADALPDYMVPSQILVLDEFPLTPNKKIDRKRLPKPSELFAKRVSSAVTAPQNELEELIKGIWEAELGLENIGTRDNFFEIGGHSLRAVHVQSRLRAALKKQFPITDLFRFPTIEQLAAHFANADKVALAEPSGRGKKRKRALQRRRQKMSRE